MILPIRPDPSFSLAAAAMTVLMLLGAAVMSWPAAAQTGAADPPASQALQDELLSQMLRDPTNIDLTLRYARVATELQNFEAAITALERLLFFNPTLARPRLELGVLYYRLGS